MKNSNERPVATDRPSLQLADGIGIFLLVAVLLIVSYLRSRHQMFWGDEIMGWIVLRQPSFPALLHFWREGIDSSGFWFYFFGRLWLAVFGASELTVRLFSATGIAASAAMIWIAARRYYNILPVAAGVTFIYAVLLPLRWQLSNGRTYGVFMFAAALVIYLLFLGEEERYKSPRLPFLLATCAAYVLLAGSHILGVIYVLAFLGMQLALDLHARRFRPLLYLSAACSFLMVWFSYANIAATAAQGRPTFWTQRPFFKQLITQSILFGHRVALAIVLLLLITLLHLHVVRRRSPVYVVLLCFEILNFAIFGVSRFITSIYVDRYVMPFAFAGILLLAELFTQLREADAPWPRLRTLFPVLYLLIGLGSFFVHRLQQVTLPASDYTAALLARLPPGLPVVDADAASFVELEFYHHNDAGHRLLYPEDWPVTLDRSNAEGVSGLREMENWKAHGLYSQDILPATDVLATTHDFILLSDSFSNIWYERRIHSDPRFVVSPVEIVPRPGLHDLEIWIVHTK